MSKERYTIEHFGEFDDVESFIYDNERQRRILKSYNYGYNDLLEMLDFINSQDYENKTLAKALELACANLYDINFQLYNTEMNFVDYFKQQAEKEMNNGNS